MKSGDRVRLKGTNYTGSVTIAKETESKVIFDDGDGPDYWYYPNVELELIVLNKYPITEQMQQRLDNDFKYHSPKEDQPDRYVLIRETAKQLAEVIMRNTPPSREQSVALTDLDKVVMTANAAIARNE